MHFTLKNPVFPGWRYVFVALIIIAIGGYTFFGRGANEGATFVITPGNFREQVSVSGAVIAVRSADLGFAANGRIAGTYARVGERVAAGTILAQTENGDLVAAVAQKQAVLDSLLSGTRPEQIAIVAAAVASGKAKLVNAITAAYTASDDAVHNKTDTFFSNPRSDPKLTFSTSNANLKAAIEIARVAMESALLEWASLAKGLSSENVASASPRTQNYLNQVVAFLADGNAAINQGISDSTVSSATLTSYGTTLATARANVNNAAVDLTTAVSALTDAEKELALDEAGSTTPDINAARAEVENARAALGKTLVRAPFSGIVTRMDAKVGEIVSPTTSLISMQSDGVFQVETFVPEVVIARVKVGNPATTTLDAYGPSVAFPATVVSVNPAETVRDGVPTYRTTLAFLAADSRIRSGMTVNVLIETGVLHDAIVIPAGAVSTENGISFVSVVNGDSVTSRTITVGSSPALGQVEILSGLSKSDVILLAPAL